MGRSSQQSFPQRMIIGGDWAEEAFVEYAKHHGYQIERYGFKRIISNYTKLPAFVRHTPDYVMMSKKGGYTVECKGTGRGTSVSLKLKDIPSLIEWSDLSTLLIFVYDSDKKAVALKDFKELHTQILEENLPVNKWDVDNVEYYKIPKSWFDWEKITW